MDGVLTRRAETCSRRGSNGDRRDTGGVQRPSAHTTTDDENRSTRNVRRKARKNCTLVTKHEGLLSDGGINGDRKQYNDIPPKNERRNGKQSGELGGSKNAGVLGLSNRMDRTRG